jgi:nitrite reductase/ring-hydroxylating ferredoxin subunit
MGFEAGWYALALGDGLEPGTSAGTQLFDKELVIWRDASGASHVWEDRCPHRGMRLSFGFVRGNHIACLYHGWQYDEAGQCRHIPAHPSLEVPETIKVPTYASVEAMGMIWVQSEADAAGAPPVDIAAAPVRSLYIDRAPETVALALQAGVAGSFEALSPSTFSATLEGAELFIALQPYCETRTALHIARTGGELALKDIAIWAEDLRTLLESMPASAQAALTGQAGVAA